MAVFATVTPELVHTLDGSLFVSEQIAAVWKFADAMIASVTGLVGSLRPVAMAERERFVNVSGE
jgi:hypothetical protein